MVTGNCISYEYFQVCFLFALNLGNDRCGSKAKKVFYMETDVGFILMVEFNSSS